MDTKIRWDIVVLAILHETGSPLRVDPLSITGEHRVRNPVFDYLLAFLVLITPAMYKILPNFFTVLLLIPLYFITLRFTQSKPASFVAVFLAAASPILFSSYLHTPSAVPIALFLFLTMLSLMHDTERHLRTIIVCGLFLTILHPIIFLFVFEKVFY